MVHLISRLVTAVACLATALSETAQSTGFLNTPADVRRTEDVIYGRKFGMALTMDVFQPAKPNGCGVLFLVNGGWLSSKDTPLMVTIRPSDYQIFLERGYTVFAVVTSIFASVPIRRLVHRLVAFIKPVREHRSGQT